VSCDHASPERLTHGNPRGH